KKWEMLDDASLKAIPLQLGDQFLADQRDVQPCYDISCVPKYEYSSFVLGTVEDAKSAIEMLHQDHQQWRGKALRSQHQIFSKIALKLREKRNDIIASFLMGASFSYIEADSELNRIIDFLEFYPQSLYFYEDFSQLISEGRGVAFITSSTPQLISEVIGGVVAGLIAGNSIICALSGEIFFPYWNLFQVFYENGVSPETLILFPCSSETLQSIIQNPVADIILSFGSKERFLEITQNNPEIPVLGHYQEKALMVVSAMADHQQAIRHIIESFAILSNQKQGALSLLILEEEVYYKKLLQNKVIDSIQSVGLGSVWDFSTIATPILNFDEKELILKDGETWLLKPKQDPSNEHLWSLGVKLVQQPTLQISDNHLPVLELKLVDDFQEAIELTKQLSQYSIACLESLDPKEIQQWKNEVQVGSVYINEKTTESFTARQPFGGIGKGRKIGGDNYLLPLMVHHEVGLAKKQKVKEDYAVLEKLNFWVEKIQSNEKFADFFQRDLEQITLAASNYLHWWESYFEQNHDYYRIRGQDNIVRYHSIGTVVICVHEDDTLFEVFARIIAAHIADCEIIISYSNNADSYVTQFLDLHVGYLREDFFVLKQNSAELLELMSKAKVLRYAHPDRVPAEIYEAAAQTGFYLCVEPPLMEGRLELLHYLKEQTVTYSYHRFGNLEQRTLMS
ncbi:MAG: RHH-type proline utilization regulon transcriptional repressor/proline dehydrogenase, partial [bacterium]